MKALVDINRRSRDGDNRIEFVIKLGVGHTITTAMSAEDFMMAMTGRSEVPVEVKTRNVRIDMASKQVKS